MILPNSPLFLISAIASSRINANFLPIGTQYKPTETSYILRHAKPKILIISSDYIENIDPTIIQEGTQIWVRTKQNQIIIPFPYTDVDAALASAPPLPLSKLIKSPLNVEQNDANQLIMYTSGTTGKPKGATRNISDLGVEGILNLATALNINFNEKLYICTPLYHAAPWAMAALVLGFGGQLILSDKWQNQETLNEIEASGATSWLVVPTLIRRWLDLSSANRPPSLQKVYSAGARFPSAWKTEASQTFGPIFYDFYGATELGIVSVANPQDCIEKPTSVGRILPHIQTKLQPHPNYPPQQGALFASGQNFSGYLGQSSPQSPFDGFFSVGDIAEIKDQYLYIVDRISDLIISGGVNIYPAEIEALLRSHPNISDAAVIGVPDPSFGEAIAAFIVPSPASPPPSPQEITAFCEKNLARFKKPKYIEFLDVLPISPQGKVLKRQLRDLWLELHPTAPA